MTLGRVTLSFIDSRYIGGGVDDRTLKMCRVQAAIAALVIGGATVAILGEVVQTRGVVGVAIDAED